MAFDFGSLVPSMNFSMGSLIKMLLWGTIIGGGLGFGIKTLKDKIKYQYFGIILRKRQSLEKGIPESKVVFGKAGYFTKQSGKTVFRIKYGLMPWQQVELTILPDPEHMIDRMVFYEQLNKDNLVQCRVDIDWDGGLNIKPVTDELKYGAFLEFYEKGKTLETTKLTPVVVGMSILGIILVAGIIVFYFLGKA